MVAGASGDEARAGAAARIVLLGATGYTGRLIVAALAAQGRRPRLVGRDPERLGALAHAAGGLEHAVADIARPAALAALLAPGDVLLTTVGPYARHGRPALEAAIAAGAHYLDITGEIAFAREVCERYDPEAAAANVMLHTAAGYDFVPGHCLAAVLLERAGRTAVRVDLGYYATGGERLVLSQGTRASLAQAMLAPGVFWQGGRWHEGPGGTSVRRFALGGRDRPAVSISSTEHLFLPRLYPWLRDVNVYLGWFGAVSALSPLVSRSLGWLQRSPRLTGLLAEQAARRLRSGGEGPSEAERQRLGSHVIGATYDDRDRELGRAELVGVNGYDFTARYAAALAAAVADGRVTGRGALDPISARGATGLARACRDAGLVLRSPA